MESDAVRIARSLEAAVNEHRNCKDLDTDWNDGGDGWECIVCPTCGARFERLAGRLDRL